MAVNLPKRSRGWKQGFLPLFPHIGVELPNSRLVIVVCLLVAVVGGAALGLLSVLGGLFKILAVLLGMAGLIVLVSDVRAGLWATAGVITLLPFAVIPVRFGLTLTLLEAAAIATLGVWLLRTLLRRDERMRIGITASLVALFLAVTLFAFLLGVGRGYTPQTFHDYGKFILAVLLVFVVWNELRGRDDIRRFVTVLLLGGGAAAALGLVLYAGGPGVTGQFLFRLIPYGYPSDRVVRFIEDDPNKAMRLVSTSVDPNSFGGLLAVVAVLACAQFIARERLVSRWVSGPTAAFTLLAVLLTFSRGAWVGVAAGFAVLTLLRYRWLVIPGVTAAAAVALLGIGSGFVQRMWLGLTLQDPATKLRLAEYRNALEIIRAHPVFGVGFGDAPTVNLQTGVSSVYLSIAERVGLVGLVVFLAAVGAVGLRGFRHWCSARDDAGGELLLGLLAALASALTVGVFDHYFFNITFPHMAGLFWILCGLILTVSSGLGEQLFGPDERDVVDRERPR